MLRELEKQVIEEIREINKELLGEPPKQSFADKAYNMLYIIFYTIVWWILVIPCAIIKGFYQALKDQLDNI